MNIFSFRYQVGMLAMLLAPEPGAGGGGGGAPDPKPDDTMKAVLDRLDKLEKENAELKKAKGGGGDPDPGDDPDLVDKAKKERETKERQKSDAKTLERALQFSMTAKEFIKENSTLLPKDIEGIFAEADKETYDSATEKSGAIQAGIIKGFFQVQDNLDLLTPSQKSAIEEFLKLTKNGRQEKAPQLYDQIFEPTFAMLKRIKKAEQLNIGGKEQSAGEKALAERMLQMSKKHYLGEKA